MPRAAKVVAEVHLDHPGEITWFAGRSHAPITGLCSHTCPHHGQAVVAWGPSYDRYELVECQVKLNEHPDGCGGRCRAWADSRGRIVTDWITVDLRRSTRDVDQPASVPDAVLAAPLDQAVRLPDVSAPAVPVTRCTEHGKVLPHYRCQESERWLDELAVRTTETNPSGGAS
jgi:hypothetical protein